MNNLIITQSNLTNMMILSGLFLVLFASAELMYHYFNVKVEITRKYVHLMTGILTMLFPFMLGDIIYVFLLCMSFLVILLGSMKFKLLPSINAVERKTSGSILYPIIVFCCFGLSQYYGQFIYYYIPILVLAISDPIATLLGKRYPFGPYKTFGQTKTFTGSIGFLISSLLISFILIYINEDMSISRLILLSLMIGVTTTLAEALTHNGYDNFTIPGAAVLVLASFRYFL